MDHAWAKMMLDRFAAAAKGAINDEDADSLKEIFHDQAIEAGPVAQRIMNVCELGLGDYEVRDGSAPSHRCDLSTAIDIAAVPDVNDHDVRFVMLDSAEHRHTPTRTLSTPSLPTRALTCLGVGSFASSMSAPRTRSRIGGSSALYCLRARAVSSTS
jgi:hypothetical protein